MRKHCASVVLLFVIVLITCETCESLSLRMTASSSNKSKKMHIEEVDEDKKVLFRYSIEKEKESTGLTREAGSVFWDRVKTFSIRNAARKTLLPIGYPASVPKEYTTFQCWNLVQDSSSFVRRAGVARLDMDILSRSEGGYDLYPEFLLCDALHSHVCPLTHTPSSNIKLIKHTAHHTSHRYAIS